MRGQSLATRQTSVCISVVLMFDLCDKFFPSLPSLYMKPLCKLFPTLPSLYETTLQVPLGIQPKNENKGEEMVQILSHMHQYVPVIEQSEDYYIPSIDETVQVRKASLHPILMGGDQLTAARARGAKKAKVNDDSPTSRLDGLVPVAEDWHTKVLLLKVN